MEEEIENRIVERQLQTEYEQREQEQLEKSGRGVSLRERIHYKLINKRNGSEVDDEDNGTVVDHYLTEQNLKFNELINRNMDYVPHSKITLNEVYKLEDTTLSFIDNKHEVNELNEFKSKHNLEDAEVERLLDSVDEATKFKIHQQLNKEFDHETSIEHLTNLEKVEILIILIIKINFLLIKKSIPVTKQLYQKFTSNQLLLFNNHNFNKLLNYLIKFFNAIDNNYNHDELNELNLNEVNEYNVSNDDNGIINKIVRIMPTVSPMNIIRLSVGSPSIITIAEEFVKQLQ